MNEKEFVRKYTGEMLEYAASRTQYYAGIDAPAAIVDRCRLVEEFTLRLEILTEQLLSEGYDLTLISLMGRGYFGSLRDAMKDEVLG